MAMKSIDGIINSLNRIRDDISDVLNKSKEVVFDLAPYEQVSLKIVKERLEEFNNVLADVVQSADQASLNNIIEYLSSLPVKDVLPTNDKIDLSKEAKPIEPTSAIKATQDMIKDTEDSQVEEVNENCTYSYDKIKDIIGIKSDSPSYNFDSPVKSYFNLFENNIMLS